MLEIRNLYAGYGGSEIIKNICLTLLPGQITAIVGPNGSGKSTLLKAITGIAQVTQGAVTLDGRQLLNMKQQEKAQQAAYLSQGRSVPDITVGRLVLHGRFPYLSYPRRYSDKDQKIAAAAMEKLQIGHLANTPMRSLSGGQQQKAYIAMILGQDTPLVLLDEPTTYLDISHQLQFLQLARELADSGKHVAVVLHDLGCALEFADQIAVMEGGGIVAKGTAQEVFESRALDRVFGISLQRHEIQGKWHYFCTK